MRSRWAFVLVLATALCLPLSVLPSFGDPNTLIMEHEEEICKECTQDSNTAFMHSVVVGNADGGGNLDIVTGGANKDHGDVSVFGWDGISLEEGSPIPGQPPPTEGEGWTIRAVTLGKVVSSEYTNIVAIGEYLDPEDGKEKGRLRVFKYQGAGLMITDAGVDWENHSDGTPYETTRPTDVAVRDLDGDSQVEVVTASRVQVSGQWRSEIRVWHRNITTLETEACELLPLAQETGDPHISIGNVDDEPLDEIVIAVDYLDSGLWKGRIYMYDYPAEGNLNREEDRSWFDESGVLDVKSSSIALANIDSDAFTEMVVVGTFYVMETDVNNAAIWVFYWDNGTIYEEVEHTWADSWGTGVWLGNADSDDDIEIVTSGYYAPQTFEAHGQVGVWHSTGSAIEREVLHNFGQLTALHSVSVGDVDGDDETEIITVGHRDRSGLPDPAILEIWTWNTVPPPQSDDWPMFHHDMANKGHSSSTAPSNASYEWQYRHRDGALRLYHTTFSPVAANGVLLTSVHGVVYAFDYTNLLGPNPLLWSTRVVPEDYVLTHSGVASLAVHNDRVYYGGADLTPTPNALLVALDLVNGSELWRNDDFDYQSFSAPPTPYGGRLFVSTYRILPTEPHGKLYCFDKNGNEIWSFAPEEFIFSAATVYGTSVFIRAGAELYSLPVEDPNGDGMISIPGEINWVFDMGIWSSMDFMEVVGSPTIQEDVVYVGSHDGFLYALPVDDPDPISSPKEITMAEKIWKSPQQLGDFVASTPAVPPYVSGIANYLFVGADEHGGPGFLYKIDVANGTVAYSVQYSDGVFSSSPAIADGKVYMWGKEGVYSYLYAYDEINLNPLWSVLVDKVTRQITPYKGNSPAIVDGIVFVGNGVNDRADLYLPEIEGFIFAIWE